MPHVSSRPATQSGSMHARGRRLAGTKDRDTMFALAVGRGASIHVIGPAPYTEWPGLA